MESRPHGVFVQKASRERNKNLKSVETNWNRVIDNVVKVFRVQITVFKVT